MNAHDHYLDAERHLNYAKDSGANSADERGQQIYALTHAVLALAATNGANRSAGKLDVRTMSDPPQQGEEIDDQMGGEPVTAGCDNDDPWCSPESPCSAHRAKDVDDDPPFCVLGNCYRDQHHDTEPHIDAEGREFR